MRWGRGEERTFLPHLFVCIVSHLLSLARKGTFGEGEDSSSFHVGSIRKTRPIKCQTNEVSFQFIFKYQFITFELYCNISIIFVALIHKHECEDIFSLDKMGIFLCNCVIIKSFLCPADFCWTEQKLSLDKKRTRHNVFIFSLSQAIFYGLDEVI